MNSESWVQRELFKDEVAQFLLNRVYLHTQRPCLKAEHQIKWTPGIIRLYIYILYTEKLNKIIYFFALVCVQHYLFYPNNNPVRRILLLWFANRGGK